MVKRYGKRSVVHFASLPNNTEEAGDLNNVSEWLKTHFFLEG